MIDSTDTELAQLPLAKYKSMFQLEYDLEAGFTTVVDKFNNQDADTAEDATAFFLLSSCIYQNEACSTNAFALNQDFELCIYLIKERMMIENINTVFMK